MRTQPNETTLPRTPLLLDDIDAFADLQGIDRNELRKFVAREQSRIQANQ